MARGRITICSGCIESFQDNDLYTVQRECHQGHPESGYYASPRCEKCIKDKESYHSIISEPKNKKK